MAKQKPSKMTPHEFVFRAIETLVHQEGSKSKKGIHTRMSGFNEAFKLYFNNTLNPREVTEQMRKDGLIVIFGSKGGGVMLYRRESVSEKRLEAHDEYWRKADAGDLPKKKSAGPATGQDALSQMQT